MSAMLGYFGKLLKIDVSTGCCQTVEISQDDLRRFIGGTGLGTNLLLAQKDYEFEPFDPRSSILFSFSPLVGSPLTTSAKFAVLSRSPLTNRLNDSMAGSSFALAGKKTGHDAILITGKSKTPSTLVIDGASVRLIDAAQEWGLNCGIAHQQLQQKLGRRFQIALIGPAGENLVRYATISHSGRHAGRGGSGALLGSKNIKAIAVAGDQRTNWANPKGLVEFSRQLSKKSVGQATAKYREIGTIENLTAFNRLGALPTRNFQAGSFAGTEKIAPEKLDLIAEKTRSSCAACTIGCEHIYKIKSSSANGTPTAARMEYENLFALGPLCEIDDPAVVIEASQLCDELGLDTISSGASIAFAMECSHRQLIDEKLDFGNADDLLRSIYEIGVRKNFGNFLAEGTMRMSQQIGQGSEKFAPHVKGLEIPGYEPRALKTMALGFAVQTRGADHNRSGAYENDFSENSNRLEITNESAIGAIESENKAAIIDSLILCKFVRRALDEFYADAATMLNLITGAGFTKTELQTTAERIVAARKLYNINSGWVPADDTLPDRFFEDSCGEFNQRIDRQKFQSAIQCYNLARGWNADGTIDVERLRQLDLATDQKRRLTKSSLTNN